MLKRLFTAVMLACTVLSFPSALWGQASPFSISLFAPQTFTATAQTGTPIQLNGLTVQSTVGSSFASANITITGSGLTTATWAVQGSSDNGVSYFPVTVFNVSNPASSGTTVTSTTDGLYRVSLASFTHVRFVTSGTFTASSIVLRLSANPNAMAADASGSGTVTASAIASAIQTQTGCNTSGYVWQPQSNTCVAPSGGSSVSVNGSTVANPNFKNSTGAGGTTFSAAGPDVTATLNNPSVTVNGVTCTLGASCSIAANYITASALGVYNFTQTGVTAGGTLTDSSGNGNDCTVGSTPPTQDGFGWRGTGTANNATVCPTALDPSRTFYFAITDPPPLLGGYVANNEVYLGSTQAAGLNLVGYSCCGLALQQYYSFWQFNAATTNGTTLNQLRNGFGVWTLVCSATPVVYLNGVAVATSAYVGRAACQTQTAPNQFEFFASQAFSNGTNATFHKAMFYSTQHTAAEVRQNYAAILNELTVRGVAVRPFPYTFTVPQIFLAADSIGWGSGLTPAPTVQPDPYTTGTASSQTWFNRMTLSGTFGLNNYGVPSAMIQQQNVSSTTLYTPLCSTNTSFSTGILHEGTNNMVIAGLQNAQDVYNQALAWKTKVQGAGCKAVIRAMLSRTGATCGANPSSCDSYKVLYNAVIRARWKQDGWDDFMDDEAFTDRGINGAYATWGGTGSTDGVHPNATIHGTMAAMASDHINSLYFGSTPANPNPTAVSAAVYTSLVVDGGLNFDTSAAPIVDTLFSATGWSGRIVKRCNIAPSGSNTLTVTAPSDFPFNNKTGNVTAVVNPGSCVSFQSTFISATTGGNFWALI